MLYATGCIGDVASSDPLATSALITSKFFIFNYPQGANARLVFFVGHELVRHVDILHGGVK
jgi:hypothetical protein